LGAKTSDPTLDNDGNALGAGALYFSSTLGVMRLYTGSAWTAAYVSGDGVLLQANNLSDLTSIATARTNLGLATVATSGAYSDLSGKPTVPSSTTDITEGANLYFTDARARSAISATGSLSYNSTTGAISYTAPTLATVATTGAYSDLTGKPTLGTLSSQNADAVAITGGTITGVTMDSITNHVGADHIHYKVKATQTLAKGDVVKVVGFNSGEDAFEVAKVSASTDIAVGVIYSALANGDYGSIINTGLLEGIDTSAFAIGTTLYPNTSGGFTSTKPTSGRYQALAFVVRSHASQGTILIEASEPQPTSLSQFTNDSGYTTNTGTVTSVGGTGTVNGITLTGTVTSSGSLTLGGTLSGVDLTSQVTGTLPVANGGTGVTSLTSNYLVKGNGTSAVSASVVYDNGTNVGIGNSDPGYRLDISAADTTSGLGYAMRLRSNATAAAAAIQFTDSSVTAQNGLISCTDSGILTLQGGDGGSAAIAFRTGGGERFKINNTGGITSSDLADAVGYKGLPQNSQTSSYTLALADIGKHISITTGGVVIPANGTVAFPIGATIVVFNNSGSNQTISITTDTLRQAGTANTGSRTLAQYGLATCVKVTATTWVVSGNVT
jgi:hypothetical protein